MALKKFELKMANLKFEQEKIRLQFEYERESIRSSVKKTFTEQINCKQLQQQQQQHQPQHQQTQHQQQQHQQHQQHKQHQQPQQHQQPCDVATNERKMIADKRGELVCAASPQPASGRSLFDPGGNGGGVGRLAFRG
uniref:Uncharacterized protein n=1 Tax=Anopheles merus TaxID=30066 RepID=A0A182V2K1_ANOME